MKDKNMKVFLSNENTLKKIPVDNAAKVLIIITTNDKRERGTEK